MLHCSLPDGVKNKTKGEKENEKSSLLGKQV